MRTSYSFLFFMLLTALSGFAQTKSEAVKLYDAGNMAFSKNDYRTADSLFSLSLDLEPHPDAYYNRAVCRRKRNDVKGYCLDLLGASDLGDPEAYTLYWKQCAKRDTIYKKLNGDNAFKADFEIVEYITSYKYNSDFEYQKCDTAKDLLLSKVRRSNETIYRACLGVKEPEYPGGMDSLVQYIKRKTNFSKLLKENDLAGITKFSLLIDENGNVKNVKQDRDELVDKATAEFLKALAASAWTPALFNERKVKFELELSVTYYDEELSLAWYPFIVKNKSEVFKVVGEMPEFPGGPMEMMKFIQKNITYPQMAKEAGLGGKCFLKFVILPNGRISNIQILKGIPKCAECDKEAIRVIANMPKWKPGTQNGKPVPVFFNLPINFHLK